MGMNKVIKIKARYVVAFEQGGHVVYEHGELVYQGDTIIFVGKSYHGKVDEIKEWKDCILIPGFIDLDADVDSDHALQDIAVGTTFQMNRKKDLSLTYSQQDFRSRHRFSMAHLMKHGITTILPISGETFYRWGMSVEECDIMIEEAQKIGIRMYVGPSFKSRKYPDEAFHEKQGEKSYQEAITFCERSFSDLIRPFMNPCQIHITELSILKRSATYARDHHIPYRLHACEAGREWSYTDRHFGKTSITLFHDEDMLYDQFIIPHCITATNEELRLLADHQVSVVSTPFADCNTGTALFSFDKYVSYGINMTMGSDTHPGDMLRNMKMAWDLDHLCHRRKFFSTYQKDGTMIPMLPNEPIYEKTDAKHYFDAATINGARALGRDDLGKLCAGAKADMVAINLHDILIGPIHDPIRTLINSATGAQVQEVIINGVTRISQYEFVDLDVRSILSDAQIAYDRYVRLYEEYDQNHTPMNQLFPPSYPIK